MKDILLDQKDHDILHALKKNARKTVAELSKELKIPRATVHERIMKLKKSGVIRRFTIEQDYRKTGLPTLAFIYASYERGAKEHQIAEKIAKIPGVLGVYIISGEWDILVKARGKSIEDIGTLIVNQIRKIPGISKTHTVACFDVIADDI